MHIARMKNLPEMSWNRPVNYSTTGTWGKPRGEAGDLGYYRTVLCVSTDLILTFLRFEVGVSGSTRSKNDLFDCLDTHGAVIDDLREVKPSV